MCLCILFTIHICLLIEVNRKRDIFVQVLTMSTPSARASAPRVACKPKSLVSFIRCFARMRMLLLVHSWREIADISDYFHNLKVTNSSSRVFHL